ncbi:Protein containing DUF1009 [Candidatus Magnetomoraceae bacterium gMMP-13]
MKKIGLIAGSGQFPIIFCQAARDKSMAVYAVAHIGETDKELESYAEVVKWIHLGKLGRMIKFFKKHGITSAVMAGAITKTKMFKDVRPDFRALSLLTSMDHTRDDAVLRAFADVLEKEGITIKSSTFLLPELLAPDGCWTRRKPKKSEQMDMDFGWNLAKKIGELDIGQCLVVQGRSVLAVEAIDGSDATIKRGGSLGSGKAVVIKICKPHQDLRFDLPALGINTIKTMKEAGASVLLVEAGKSIVFDKKEMIALADRYGISIVGRKAD